MLPEDCKAYMMISDGLNLTWRVKKEDGSTPLGCMHINKLRDIKKIKGETFKFSSLGEADKEELSDDDEKLIES